MGLFDFRKEGEEPWDELRSRDLDLKQFAANCQCAIPKLDQLLEDIGSWQAVCLYVMTTRQPQFNAAGAREDMLIAIQGLRALCIPRDYCTLDAGLMELVAESALEFDLYESSWQRRGYLTVVRHFLLAYSALYAIAAGCLRVGKDGGVDLLSANEYAFLRCAYHLDR